MSFNRYRTEEVVVKFCTAMYNRERFLFNLRVSLQGICVSGLEENNMTWPSRKETVPTPNWLASTDSVIGFLAST